MKTILLCGFISLALSMTQSLAGPVAPTPPDVLLAAAPTVPVDWKKAVGRAQSVISGSGVPVSIATRVYDIEIPVKDAPPIKVRVTINLQDQGGDFALQENVFGDAAKMVSLSGHKAVVLPMGESSTLLQINIPPRLGMSVTVQGLGNDEALKFLKQIDPAAFFALSTHLSEKRYPGNQFSLGVVDEMNPQRNARYQQGVVETEPQDNNPPPPR
ncbi:MAG: hypothetical protein WCH98_23680 [Verrucomicrobiota bacterium]